MAWLLTSPRSRPGETTGSIPFGTSTYPFRASRGIGYAPLAVFFRPARSWAFRDIEKTRFVWSVDGVQQFVGYNFSAVFETVGSHVVSVQVSQLGVVLTTQSVSITVQTWTGTDFYVANGGSDSNPGTQSQPFATIDHATSVLFGSAGPRRLLVARGSSFTSAAVTGPNVGPYRIGVYGSGAKPNITTGEVWLEDAASRSDIAISDLNIIGPNTYTPGSGNACLNMNGNNLLALRCDFYQCSTAIAFLGSKTTQGKFVFNCTITQSVLYDIATEGLQIGLMNNTVDGSQSTHLIRILYFYHALVANTTSKNGFSGRHHLKCHGDSGEAIPAQRLLVSNNVYSPVGDSGWIVSIGPENTSSPEKSKEIIVEKNTFVGDTGAHTAVESRGSDYMVIRNNGMIDIDIPILGTAPVPGFSTWDGWRVYYNSAYSATAGETAFMEMDDGAVHDMQIYDNIMYSPNSVNYVAPLELNPVAIAEITDTNNIFSFPHSTNFARAEGVAYSFAAWQTAGKGANDSTSNPLYVSPGTGNLALQGGSPALDAAVRLNGGFEDRNGVLRPYSGGLPDIGEFET